ncbi:hypothetical protein MUK42_13833 [Musa troglodytarum]|uniref:Uncharacterized protein n=1 Tax=Musa troglodytarum TaxID=320322 RepID=A0A9E7EN16_9LILI|nr:hypothetical protein MUK42_13833 [Musa troglodytarum]
MQQTEKSSSSRLDFLEGFFFAADFIISAGRAKAICEGEESTASSDDPHVNPAVTAQSSSPPVSHDSELVRGRSDRNRNG